jgi:hypothetical protein
VPKPIYLTAHRFEVSFERCVSRLKRLYDGQSEDTWIGAAIHRNDRKCLLGSLERVSWDAVLLPIGTIRQLGGQPPGLDPTTNGLVVHPELLGCLRYR